MGTPHISTTFTRSGGERSPSPRLGDEEVAARRRGQTDTTGGQEPGSRPHCRRQNQGLLETGAPAEALPRWVICKTEEEEGGAVAGQAGFTRLLPAPTLCAARGPRQPVACPSGGTWKMRISRPPPAPTVPLTSTSPPWFPPGPVATLSTLSFLLPSHSSLFLSPVIAFPSPSYTHKDPSRKAR